MQSETPRNNSSTQQRRLFLRRLPSDTGGDQCILDLKGNIVFLQTKKSHEMMRSDRRFAERPLVYLWQNARTTHGGRPCPDEESRAPTTVAKLRLNIKMRECIISEKCMVVQTTATIGDNHRVSSGSRNHEIETQNSLVRRSLRRELQLPRADLYCSSRVRY